jgi:hypothetical protein
MPPAFSPGLNSNRHGITRMTETSKACGKYGYASAHVPCLCLLTLVPAMQADAVADSLSGVPS